MNGLDKIKFAQQIAADLDFIIYKGTTFQSSMFYKTESGKPYDLTDVKIDLTAIHSKHSNVSFKINTKIAEPELGKIEIYLSKEEIDDIPLSETEDSYWNYTMTITTKNGIIYRILQGIIKIEV